MSPIMTPLFSSVIVPVELTDSRMKELLAPLTKPLLTTRPVASPRTSKMIAWLEACMTPSLASSAPSP